MLFVSFAMMRLPAWMNLPENLFFPTVHRVPFFDRQEGDLPTPAIASALIRARRAWISPRSIPLFI
jgi:hypothetical protein